MGSVAEKPTWEKDLEQISNFSTRKTHLESLLKKDPLPPPLSPTFRDSDPVALVEKRHMNFHFHKLPRDASADDARTTF